MIIKALWLAGVAAAVVACDPFAPGSEACYPTTEWPLAVDARSLPRPGFVVDPVDPEQLCFEPDGVFRGDACGRHLYMRCAADGSSFTYCPSAEQQVAYGFDPFTGEDRLFCQLQ